VAQSGTGTGLPAKCARVVEAVLAGGTQTAIAARLGMGRRTLCRYLARPDVREALTERGQEALSVALRGLQGATGDAVETLTRLMRSGSPQVELGAARAVLDVALRVQELDRLGEIEARLSRLEVAISETGRYFAANSQAGGQGEAHPDTRTGG